MEEHLFHYRVTESPGNYDGDTIRLVCDLGFGITNLIVARLEGIDTPEMGEPGSMEARDFLTGVIDDALFNRQDVIARTRKTEKYGRWLVTLFIDGQDVNQMMIDNGLARPYFGGAKA